MTQAYVYARFSTPGQELGNSLERQLELCQNYCDRTGLAIVETLTDRGRSAWKGDHLRIGHLGKLANRIHAGNIAPGSTIVVEQLDRLSRLDPIDVFQWMIAITNRGVAIATVEGPQVWTRESLRGDQALIQIMSILMGATVAHGHSKRKSGFNLDNWERRIGRARNLEIISRRVPAWLSVVDKRWSLNASKVSIVREVYQWSAEGQGNRQIAGRLNARGEPSFGGRGALWTDKYIGLLLASPAVEGDYIPRASVNAPSDKIVGYFPRIVDAELVAQARAASIQRRGTGGRYRHRGTNLFAQSVYCQGCGGPMTLRPRQADRLSPKSSLRKGLWQCRAAMQKRGCDRRQMYAYAPLENAALDVILHLVMDDTHFAKNHDANRLANDVADLAKRRADLRLKQERGVSRLLDHDEPPPEIEEALARIRYEIAEIDRQSAIANDALAKARGEVDPVEHVRRVREVRAMIDTQDEPVREEARRKITTAMQGMGVQVICGIDHSTRERRIMLRIPVANLTYIFDAAGNLLSGIAPEQVEADVPDAVENRRRADYVRRRADAAQPDRPFEGLTWRSEGEQINLDPAEVLVAHKLIAA